MKTVLTFQLYCSRVGYGQMPSLYAELTDADLDKIRLIVKEEIKKEATGSEARIKRGIFLKKSKLSTSR